MSNKIYTNEELLEILKKQFELNPNTVASDFRAKYGLPYYQVYIKRFGGFTKAKYLAGITSELKEKSSWSKEIIIQTIKNVYSKNKYCSLSYDDMCKLHDYLPSIHVVLNYFTSLAEVLNICKIITLYNKPKEYLIHELQRFVNEFNRLPTYNDFETSTGYPSRKTFDKYFTNVDSALIEAGYGDYKFIRNNMLLTLNKEKEYETMTLEQKKVFLINTLYDFVEKYNHVPTGRELDENINYLNKGYYRTVFNKYNNALIEAGLELNSVSQYEDKFLKQEFLRFVDEHGRIPYLHEFNVSEYPSFWCYQNRFGSWNKAVIAYGFEPNDSDTTYYLDNGEKCMSRYEWDISRWLLKNDIEYTRDIPYIYIHNKYKGRMDCDYKIITNSKIYFVEMAGFYSRNFEKASEQEILYAKKLNYKIKLLNESKVNYLIIYPEDIKYKSLEEIFSFLKLN